MMITNMKKKPIELYIHIPFCVKKCDYCDFLSFRALSSVHEAYVQQLILYQPDHGNCIQLFSGRTGGGDHH